MEDEILCIEEAIIKSQLAQDSAFFEAILSDDFKFITSQGHVVSKRQDIDQYKSGYLKLKNVVISDRTVCTYGNTAIVRLKAKFEGRAGTYDFMSATFMTRVYVKGSEGWKIVAGHGSDITDPTP